MTLRGDNDQKLILNVQLLSDLRNEALEQLIKDAFVQGLPKGTILFEQGATAKFLYVVLSGRVAITSSLGESETIILIRETGEAILDIATLLGVPYVFGARLVEGGRIMMIPISKFRDLAFNDAATVSAVIRAIVNTNLVMASHIRDLKLLTTIQRLARHILSLTPEASGNVRLNLRDDRPVIAALLGMTPESLSRAFAQLRAIGVRVDKKGAVVIDNVRKLRTFCRDDGNHKGRRG